MCLLILWCTSQMPPQSILFFVVFATFAVKIENFQSKSWETLDFFVHCRYSTSLCILLSLESPKALRPSHADSVPDDSTLYPFNFKICMYM